MMATESFVESRPRGKNSMHCTGLKNFFSFILVGG